MKLKWISFSFVSVVAMLMVLVPSTLHADVHDNANIFSQSAVENANNAMKKMERIHNKQFVVETFAAVPDDQKDAALQNPDEFFKQWMASRAKELKVNGVYVLICMDPHKLQVGAGKNTIAHGDFTKEDIESLEAQMKSALHDKEYDKALSDAVDTVERAYTANISSPNGRSVSSGETEYSTSRNQMPGVPFPSNSSGTGISFGSLICLAVGAVIIFSLIKSVFRGTNSGGYGGGNFGGGNYPPTNQGYGQNYGGGFGYGGGGGGGFGRGFLGGLLGGALGGYAADRFDHRNDPSSAGFPQNDNFGNFGGGGGGGSFDSGPSDAGQGFGDNSSGGDFGSSGGDSGGGGGGDF